eukprot:6178120-Pleurochrysis_carterae.AAC.2
MLVEQQNVTQQHITTVSIAGLRCAAEYGCQSAHRRNSAMVPKGSYLLRCSWPVLVELTRRASDRTTRCSHIHMAAPRLK